MCYNHVPRSFNGVGLSVHGLEGAVAIYQLQCITLNMPFRMSTGTFDDVTRERIVTFFTICGADRLAFLASYQHVYVRCRNTITREKKKALPMMVGPISRAGSHSTCLAAHHHHL